MVLPGISGFHDYGNYGDIYDGDLRSIQPEFSLSAPVAIGVVIGIVVCIKMVKYLMKRFYQGTYFAILGLVLGSVLSLWPGFSFDMQEWFPYC